MKKIRYTCKYCDSDDINMHLVNGSKLRMKQSVFKTDNLEMHYYTCNACGRVF